MSPRKPSLQSFSASPWGVIPASELSRRAKSRSVSAEGSRKALIRAEIARALGADELLTGIVDWLAVLHYLARAAERRHGTPVAVPSVRSEVITPMLVTTPPPTWTHCPNAQDRR
jgi:hypothetical protein